MRERLEKRGVIFKSVDREISSRPQRHAHDVLVNATSFGSTKLQDVQEKKPVPVKQRNIRIMRRAYEKQPDVVRSPNVEDNHFICDHIGVYPIITQEDGEVRCEKQIIAGQKVVHAYGMEAGGYVFSFGLAREIAKLVSEYDFRSFIYRVIKT
ncbi:hypothetical protein LTR41_010951 [Exophiala xenobiotica]|nr:hypothetical protein LTR41_010951 [Exophiala xenobiotica]KAK5551119.1 hypothetical protein LTR46_010872 [Exophiala xenobiotica]